VPSADGQPNAKLATYSYMATRAAESWTITKIKAFEMWTPYILFMKLFRIKSAETVKY